MIWVRNLQDPAGEVMVLIDATIALAALCHEGSVKARISHGRCAGIIVACAVAEFTFSLVFLVAIEEESCADKRGKSNHTNHHSGRDGRCVVAARAVVG